jgi:hypothetical protein
MWLLKSPFDFKLSLLTFNLLVILKATSQLGELLAFPYFKHMSEPDLKKNFIPKKNKDFPKW